MLCDELIFFGGFLFRLTLYKENFRSHGKLYIFQSDDTRLCGDKLFAVLSHLSHT